MKALFKGKWIAFLAGIVGIFVLLSAFTDQPELLVIRQSIIHWAMLVAAVLLIFAILDFVIARIRGIGDRSGSLTYNFVSVAVFLAVIIYGFAVRNEDSALDSVVFSIQSAIESALAGMVCIAMIYGIYRVARSRESLLKTAFLFSAIVFMILFSGFFSFVQLPEWATKTIEFVQALPIGGTYGLLLGMAIAGLVVGIRVLFLGEHPYKGRDK